MEFKNDLGKPWKFEEDGFTVIRTSMWSPPGCHPTGCGLKLYVDKDGRLDHVEGDENQPITRGHLCVRCMTLKDYVYNPSRILHPMVRDPKDRGKSDAWRRVTWDEAYELIKEKVNFFKKNYGPESMAVFSGTGRSGGIMCQEMAQKVLGTPNACYTQSGFACYQPRSAACSHVLGAYYPEIDYAGGLEGTYDNPEWKCPELLVMWGKAPLESNGDGLWGHAVIDIMRRGAKLISVDPRVNWLSTRSEVHLRVRPGTDTAMLMAWLYIIITENLYDADFVDRWCYGWDEFKERIVNSEYSITPEKAAEICEVDVDLIYKAARMYGNAHPAAIAWGLAFDQNQNGNQAGHCCLALMAICGNVDVPGGQIIAEIPAAPGVEEALAAQEEAEKAEGAWDGNAEAVVSFGETGISGGASDEGQKEIVEEGWEGIGLELTHKAVGYDKYPLYCENIRMAHADMMLDCLLTDKPYKIHMGWIQSTNLLSPTCCAEPSKWYKALLRLDFVIATDVFMTPSIQGCADVILPLQTCAEKDDVNFTHYCASPVMIGAINKAVDVGEAKSDADILVELGNVLGSPKIAGKFKDGRDYTDKMRAPASGEDFAALSHEVYHQRGVTYKKYEKGLLRPDRKLGFLTNTGRVELWSTTFQQNGDDPLPYYQEPMWSPRKVDEIYQRDMVNPNETDEEHASWRAKQMTHEEISETYPLILTTGARTFGFFHSEHRQIPYLRELNPNPLLEINPADAEKYKIADGQWVEIENEFGKAKYKAKVSPIVRAGIVHAQHGWWFPEEDGDAPNLYGVFKSNCNDLIPSHYNSVMGYGAPHKCMCCRVTPLAENYDTDMKLVEKKFGKLVD